MTSAKVLKMREDDEARRQPLTEAVMGSAMIALGPWRKTLGPQFGSLSRKEARRFLFTSQAEDFLRKQRTKIRVQKRRDKRRAERTARVRNRSKR